jgi:acetolactate synthase I/II/III large subunit
MENTIPVENGAEAFIELLNASEVQYIFLNPGTDTYLIQEAISKFRALGRRTPEVVLCLHESVAMSAAQGYFFATGKPQVVLVHADMGPQQVGGALHNAQRGRAGIVLCSGRVPANVDAGRLNQVHWMQEQFDQHGSLRGSVKWDYELRSNESIHHVIQRAFQFARSEPSGPVYLSLPQDALSGKMSNVKILPAEKYNAVLTPQIDASLLNQIAQILLEAKNPLIITGYAGRNIQTVASLIELAETLGARVISSQLKMNFPTTHPLFGGLEPNPYLPNTDVILVIDHDVPYVPARVKPAAGTKIIHIDIDPLKQNMPLWGFPTDFLIEADSSRALPALNQVLKQIITSQHKMRIDSRYKQVQDENRKMKEEWLKLATARSTQKPISPEWLCHCIGEVLGDEAIVIAEPVTNTASVLRQVGRTRPGSYLQSGGSNLGWGLGGALGVKLARPEETVVAIMGDGGFNFACPTAALWAANAYNVPFLCIIINNMRYNAPTLALRQGSTVTSYSEKTGVWIGVDIKPSPDYAAIARACQAYGQTVEDPAEIQTAIREALKQVTSGKAAILDVRVDINP